MSSSTVPGTLRLKGGISLGSKKKSKKVKKKKKRKRSSDDGASSSTSAMASSDDGTERSTKASKISKTSSQTTMKDTRTAAEKAMDARRLRKVSGNLDLHRCKILSLSLSLTTMYYNNLLNLSDSFLTLFFLFYAYKQHKIITG